MKDYERILELSSSKEMQLADGFKDLINTHLRTGQTRYLCRYGTLSDGHEHITAAARYYQAYHEMWNLRGNIKVMKAQAMQAQADLMDAEEELKTATKESDKLRAEAKKIYAHEKMVTSLTTAEEQTIMLDEYNKIRLELAPEVDAQYPGGIETAQLDIWKSRAEYRLHKGPHEAERLDNIPLPPEEKAKIGLQYNRADAVAPLLVSDRAKLVELVKKHAPHLLEVLPIQAAELKLVENN